MSGTDDVEDLYRELLAAWNNRDAARFAELFTDDGSMVGFDGTAVESRPSIAGHLQEIFADHQPATYVAKVREVRQLAPGVALLRSVAGMVPPGGTDIEPAVNAVQALVAVRQDGSSRVVHFQTTPAAFHGHPEAVDALTAELTALLAPGDGHHP